MNVVPKLAACFAVTSAIFASIAWYRVPVSKAADTSVISSFLLKNFQRKSENLVGRCPNTAPTRRVLQLIEHRLQAFKRAFPNKWQAASITIPVYFHIITNDAGTEGDVSEATMRAQIEVLNKAYAGKDGYGGASTPFKFAFAGDEKIRNDQWFTMTYKKEPTAIEKAVKAKNKGNRSTLNLYTIKLIDKPFGWGRYPWQPADVDGVVVGYSTLPKGGLVGYDEGDTATHEIGHWLGLLHTFEGTCDDHGDWVEDTPPGKDPAFDCPNYWNSCTADTKEDAVHNFMNYTWDSCMYQFTAGQSDRMVLMYQQHRKIQ